MGVRTIVPPLNGAGTPRRGVPTTNAVAHRW